MITSLLFGIIQSSALVNVTSSSTTAAVISLSTSEVTSSALNEIFTTQMYDRNNSDHIVDVDNVTSTTTTSSPSLLLSNSSSWSVCDDDGLVKKCPPNRYCVEDSELADGYRCCRKKTCSKLTGRCPDPGTPKQAKRRVPEVRTRRKFKTGEVVLIYCNDGRFYEMNCQLNGVWGSGKESCTGRTNDDVYYQANGDDDVISPKFTPIRMRSTSTPPHAPGAATVATDVNLANNEVTLATSDVRLEKIVIAILMLCLLIAAFTGFVIIRKRHRSQRGESTSSAVSSLKFEEEKLNEQPVVVKIQPAPMPDLMADSVSIDDFQTYVSDRHDGKDLLFQQEFQDIQNETSEHQHYTTEASSFADNMEKNRYNNIVAYDHTRVHLKDLKKQNTSCDYINANYVSGFTNMQAFIACQGPLPSTFSDFWEMVWTNNVSVIVMITNLLENGRRKCDQYWPSEGKESYKYITVSIKSTQVYANYTVRTFIVKNNKLITKRQKSGGDRKIIQYHYTQWPDHGTPDYLMPVLSFINKSSSGHQTAPIVVHCSAGVGRTGTYITIQSMIQMLKTTGSINIPTFLKYIRTQRNHLVQTPDQYVFVHDALLTYIKIGSTHVSIKDLLRYYNISSPPLTSASVKQQQQHNNISINNSAAASASTLQQQYKFDQIIEKQFNHMKELAPPSGQDTFASRPVNREKNRDGALLPVYKSCVRLRGDPHDQSGVEEGSEYINASYLQGYRSSTEFIVTQLPLENTRKHFWQLVWDVDCSTFVTLGDQEWNDDNDKYWPSPDVPLQFSSFKVTCSQEEASSCKGVIQRTFVLEATKDDYVLMVKQFHVKLWKNGGEITSEKLLAVKQNNQSDIIKMLSSYAATKEGSTIIQDRYGGTPAGEFACWLSIHERINHHYGGGGHGDSSEFDDINDVDDHHQYHHHLVDIYEIFVLACQMRPQIFNSANHLKYLYELTTLEFLQASGRLPSTNGVAVSPSAAAAANCKLAPNVVGGGGDYVPTAAATADDDDDDDDDCAVTNFLIPLNISTSNHEKEDENIIISNNIVDDDDSSAAAAAGCDNVEQIL